MIAYFKSVVEGSHRDTGKEKDMLMEQLQVRPLSGRRVMAAARRVAGIWGALGSMQRPS